MACFNKFVNGVKAFEKKNKQLITSSKTANFEAKI